MKGKVINIDGTLYVEYIASGVEADEIERKKIRLSSVHKTVEEGEEVEFQCISHHSIMDGEVAIIKNKWNGKV